MTRAHRHPLRAGSSATPPAPPPPARRPGPRRHAPGTRATLALTAVLALLAASPAGAAARDALEVEVRGNRTILTPMLLSLVEVPEHGPASSALAERIERQLEGKLRAAGYTLARIDTYAREGRLVIVVDEGRLEKIVFTGSGSWRTANLRVDFQLPGEVYNAPHVDAELKRLREKYGCRSLRAQLVAIRTGASERVHVTDVIERLGPSAAEALWTDSAARYELHIHVTMREWGDGPDFGVEYQQPWGLQVSGGYSGDTLLLDRDRHITAASLAGWSVESLRTGEAELRLTRAALTHRWVSPPFGLAWLRPFVELEAEQVNLQRADLGLDQAWRTRLDGSVNLGIELGNRLDLGFGAGAAWERVGELTLVDMPPVPDLERGSRALPFLQLRAELLLGAILARRDLRHEIVLRALEVAPGLKRGFEVASLEYQNAFAFGYDDLVLRARGAALLGAGTMWQDEVPLLSDSLRAVPGEARYGRKVGSASLEYRLGVHRDLVKVGAFVDGGGYGELDRRGGGETPRFAVAFGPGAHFLILDTFELDAYYAFGAGDGGKPTSETRVSFRKVY